MNPQHEVARELAANAQALRDLARDLVGPGMAADLVQETALRALRSPPPQPHGLAAWLATILRRLAGNHHRDTRRRSAREAAVARGEEPHPAADEEVARRELLQALTRSLWRLPEPYQSALVWRYFENLSPKQIAARKHVPIATVKSRLQRGLAMLRAEFDRRDGGRWRAMLPLAIAVPMTSPAAASAAATIMTPTTKILAAATALVTTACLVCLAWGEEPPLAAANVNATAPATTASDGALATQDDLRQRELVASTIAAAVDLAHEYQFRLRCTVLDRDGLPVKGARIVIAPRDCQLNAWPQPTGEDGTALLEWRGKLASLTMAVGLVHHGHAQALREVEVRAGEVQALALLAEQGGHDGACGAIARKAQVDCRTCHVGALLPHVFEHQLTANKGLHPHSPLVDLLLSGHATEQEEVLAFDDFGLADSTAGKQAAANTGRIQGRVIDQNGAPVAGTTVIRGVEPDRAMAQTHTRPDGTFAFDGVGEGQVLVRAGGGSPGIGRATLQVFAGRTSDCDIRLQRGEVLAGRVLLPEGITAEGWRVEYITADEAWIDGAVVAADGAFAVANVPPGAGTLLLWSQAANRLPAAIDTSTLVGSTDLRFDLRTTGIPSGALRLRPQTSSPQVSEAAAVFVWQIASRRGAMAERRKDGARELDGLAPGFYRVALSNPGSGWQDLGEHWVDGQATVDLGTVPLRAPAALHIEDRATAQLLQFYLRRPDLDLRAEPAAVGGGHLWLPGGRWLALWGDPANPSSREFDLVIGETTTLRLGEAR